MGIFAIFNVSDNDKARSAIAEMFPNDHMELRHGDWLVAAPTTAQEISDRLKFTNGENGSAIIFSMGGYYGRAPTNIWDWIKAKAEKSDG